jgi:hypothetical protein
MRTTLFIACSLFVFGCTDPNANNNNMNNQADMAGVTLPDLTTPNNNTDGNVVTNGDMALQVPCTCPTGYSCDSAGTCVGGDPSGLMLDVKTIKVSGTVTVNGKIPVTKAACTPTTVEAIVHLDDTARGHSFDIPVLCSTTGAAFDAVVFPGNYKVTVTGDADLSELPGAAYPMADLVLTADKANVPLDVKLIALDGTITLNGLAPAAQDCTGDVIVELVPTSGTGAFFDLRTPCASPAIWSGKVFPGTYDVIVLGVGDVIDSGTQAFAVTAPLDATSDRHNVVFDVKTFNVGGPITIDGTVPNMTDCSSLAGADVIFRENKTGVSVSRNAQCVTNALSVAPGKLFAGEYTVTAFGDGGPLMFQEYPVRDKLQVTGNQTSETFNVSTTMVVKQMVNVGGTVTLNGSPIVADPSCFSGAGQVVFEDVKHQTTQFQIDCDTHTFTGQVAAGVYDIHVYDLSNDSNLLAAGFPAAKQVSLQADKTNFAFDEKTVTLSGKVTLNGQDPATIGTCNVGGQDFEGTIHLFQKDGVAFDLPIPCSAGIFAWSGQVYPGTYTVSVNGRNGTSSLPDESFRLLTDVDASSNKSGINIDVLTSNVAGKLTLNGVAPSTTTQCNANPNAHKATVHLFNIDHATDFELPVLCSSTDFSWSGVVFPGSYTISVSGAGGYSSLPKNTYLAVPKLKI